MHASHPALNHPNRRLDPQSISEGCLQLLSNKSAQGLRCPGAMEGSAAEHNMTPLIGSGPKYRHGIPKENSR